jgi:glycosyltransferase involved in cell wall biosynthesis
MLSIITVTRNDREGLRRTIESTATILAESNNVEQLVIDGSDDEHAIENENICRNISQLTYAKREAKGISDAFNYGISIATHKWLWFLNGGDRLNNKLDLILFLKFLENVTADILIFQLELMQKGTIVPFPSFHKILPPVVPWIPHPATIINREIFIKYGPFDKKYKIAMDYELWLRLYGKKVVVNMVSIPIAIYDENGVSSTDIAKVSFEGREVLKKSKMRLFKLWLNTGKNILNQYMRFNRSVNGD